MANDTRSTTPFRLNDAATRHLLSRATPAQMVDAKIAYLVADAQRCDVDEASVVEEMEGLRARRAALITRRGRQLAEAHELRKTLRVMNEGVVDRGE